MASSTFKQDINDISDRSSISTTHSDSSRSSSTSTQWRSLSQLTPSPSPVTPMTSCPSLATSKFASEPCSASEETGESSRKEDATTRIYTRRAVGTVRRSATIRTMAPRTRTSPTIPSPSSSASSRSSLALVSLSKQLSAAHLEAVRPIIRRRPIISREHIHPDQIAFQNPNNIYTYGPARGPDPSKLPHPLPDIIVTDYWLLHLAASRYASSPLCLTRAQPYHNITDPRFLGRYSASEGANTARCRSQGFEVADAEAFAGMGGQESVVFLGCKRLMQRKVVARGCPSYACSCRGRGVAISKCWDWREEEEEETVDVPRLQPCRRRKVPVTDRIEDARRMRARIEQGRKARELTSRGNQKELNTGPRKGEVEVKKAPGRTKTVRRRKSKFIEVGCTPGNDLPGTSGVEAAANDREVAVEVAVGSDGDQERRRSSSSVTKKAQKSWIRKLLHA